MANEKLPQAKPRVAKLLDNYTADGYPKDHPGLMKFAREVEKAYVAKDEDFRNIIFPDAVKDAK